MKIIYIAAPFTAKTGWEIEENVRFVEHHAFELIQYAEELGLGYIAPHMNSRFFFGHGSEEYWYAMTMQLLERCDATWALPGWEESKGATREVERTKALGRPVFYWLSEVRKWASDDA